MSVPSKKIQRKKKTPLRDDKVWLFKQCETVVSFWGWDCTIGWEQEDWSGGRGQRMTLKKWLLLHLAGRNVLQMEKGNSAVSERDVSHCPYWVLLATRSDIAQLLGTETRGALLKSRIPLHNQEAQTISLYHPEGLVTQGLWCNVQTPKEDALPCKGMALVKVLGQPKWSMPLPSGEGLTRTRIIS